MRCGSAINIFYQSATLLMNRAWSSIFFLLCALTVTSMLHAATPMDKRSEEWLCGLLLTLNLGFCNPLEVWSHQLSIRCRLLAQTLYLAIQQCNLGDFSTWMKQNTSVLKKIIDLVFFFFPVKDRSLLNSEIFMFGSYMGGGFPKLHTPCITFSFVMHSAFPVLGNSALFWLKIYCLATVWMLKLQFDSMSILWWISGADVR